MLFVSGLISFISEWRTLYSAASLRMDFTWATSSDASFTISSFSGVLIQYLLFFPPPRPPHFPRFHHLHRSHPLPFSPPLSSSLNPAPLLCTPAPPCPAACFSPSAQKEKQSMAMCAAVLHGCWASFNTFPSFFLPFSHSPLPFPPSLSLTCATNPKGKARVPIYWPCAPRCCAGAALPAYDVSYE